MNNDPITPEVLADSVIAVPPLARDADLKVCPTENVKIMRHLEAGGVRTLLYGGNAMFYHIGLGEYAETLAMLQKSREMARNLQPVFCRFGRLCLPAHAFVLLHPMGFDLRHCVFVSGIKVLSPRNFGVIIFFYRSHIYLQSFYFCYF